MSQVHIGEAEINSRAEGKMWDNESIRPAIMLVCDDEIREAMRLANTSELSQKISPSIDSDRSREKEF